MDWLLLIGMTLTVFGSRYVFLEPRLPLQLGDNVFKFLSYSAPAVLAAVIGPLIFIQEMSFGIQMTNPYLIGATVAALLMLLTKNILLTVLASMFLFFFIH